MFRRFLTSPSKYYSTSASLSSWKPQNHNAFVSAAHRNSNSIFDDDTPSDLSEDEEAVNGVRQGTAPFHMRRPSKQPLHEDIKVYKQKLREKFPDGWNPPRKLSRDAMSSLRELHRLDPEKFNTPLLAAKFKISPEAIRRILKSSYEPSEARREKLIVRERTRRKAINLEKQRTEQDDLEHAAELQDRAFFEANASRPVPVGAYSRDKFSFR